MTHRNLYNGVRGLVGSRLVFPLAERLEGRDLRATQSRLAVEMSQPFAERRPRSWHGVIETVRFAAAHVAYYRDLFARIGFDPDSLVRDPRYFNDIPHLTKDIIRAEGNRLLRDDHADHRKHVAKTGGSTGPSAQIVYDQDAADWSSAVTRHARAQVGVGSAHSELHFASRFPEAFPLKDRLREQFKCLANNRFNITFSSFSAAELDRIWHRIRSIRPYLVHGHPSTLYQLALHATAKGTARRVFDIFEASGETLDRRQRDVISRAFQCRVINRYGLAEVGVAAYQTDPAGTDMAVVDSIVWPEIADVDFASELPQVGDGRSGELVVTALRNRMMPLIRYRTGDIAVLRDTPDGFQLQEVIGRVHDMIRIADTQVPTHYAQDVLDRVGGIREFQIEAVAGRALFRIVPEAGADAAVIRQKLLAYWNHAIDIEFVDTGALKLQGWRSKFRHLVSPATDG